MPSLPVARIVLSGLLALVAASPGHPAAHAQPPPAPEAEPASAPPGAAPIFEESVAVSWLLVPVVVETAWGTAGDLGREAFRLWVDDRRAPIDELDRGDDVPLSVVFLQDLSGSMANGGKLDASRGALAALLARTRPGDEVALASFAGDRLAIDVPFTAETAAVADAMAGWEGYGTTALHDAVSLLPEISQGGEKGRRVAVLVTDGLDNASALPPADAARIVRTSQLPVYVLGLGDGRRPRGDDETVRYGELLGELARSTGGRYFEVADRAAAEEAVAALIEDLRRRYVLGVATAGDGARAYHRLRVEVALPYRHTLTYRRGYHGTVPAAWAARASGRR